MRATDCWQVDGAWRVGFEAEVFTTFRVAAGINSTCLEHEVVLMQHYHDPTKIEAVPVAWLRPYPIEEISPP
jgi:hypothetical protein